MGKEPQYDDLKDSSRGSDLGRQLSRREFLRFTGMGIAAAGLGGLGLLGGCSESPGPETTAPVQTTAQAASTTVSTAPATTSTSLRTDGAPVRGGTLRLGTIGGCPQSIEPNAFTAHMTSNVIMYSLFDTLVRPKAGLNTFEWEMALAESVDMQSPTEWTVTLREGATWHDGSPVTVDDLIFSFRRALQPNSFASHMLLTIDPDRIERLPTARGETSRGIRLNLTAPDSMLIDSLWRIFIVPVGYTPAQPIGSGPYKLQSLTSDMCTLARHDGYWGSAAYTDGLCVEGFLDEASRVDALLGGRIDIAPMIDVALADKVESASTLQMLVYNTPMTYSLDMNVEIDPLSDQRVRQALRVGTDRARLADEVFMGRAHLANDLICPADTMFAADIPAVKYDPELARSLLASAGKGSSSIVLSSAALAPRLRELGLGFVEQVTAVGAHMTFSKISAAEYTGNLFARRAMSTSFWLPQPLSVQVALTRLPESRYNASRFSDETYASLFRQARAEADSAARKNIFREMQMIDYERGASIVPLTPHQVDAYSRHVGGAEPQPLMTYPDVRRLWLR
jgi:peptide/nickel transport system substrate-binding protein